MYSGHPAGLFPSLPSSPRAIITNGMVTTHPSFRLSSLYSWEKGFQKGSSAVPIVEPFLVPGKSLCGKDSTQNQKGFYLEPKWLYIEPKKVLQRVLLWGQPKNPFRFQIAPFFLRLCSTAFQLDTDLAFPFRFSQFDLPPSLCHHPPMLSLAPSQVIPNYSSREQYEKMFALGVSM